MSSFRWGFGRLLAAGALAFAVSGVGGCTFAPVYGARSGVTGMQLAYAAPGSRIEQIIYQDLSLSLGSSSAPDAPLVTVSASGSSDRIGRTGSDSPATNREATVTATLKVTRASADPAASGPETLYEVTRSASAGYTTAGQKLANDQAAEEASERAAHQLAQTLRLLLAANLPSRL